MLSEETADAHVGLSYGDDLQQQLSSPGITANDRERNWYVDNSSSIKTSSTLESSGFSNSNPIDTTTDIKSATESSIAYSQHIFKVHITSTSMAGAHMDAHVT